MSTPAKSKMSELQTGPSQPNSEWGSVEELSTVMRDAGTMVMFAGTPYAHLHICGSPWEGTEYRRGERAIWTMRYEHP